MFYQLLGKHCWRMKLKAILVYFTRIYGVLKLVQLSVYFNAVLKVILDDDCESECIVEYSEAALIVTLFVPVTLLVYGIMRVNLFNKLVCFCGIFIKFSPVLIDEAILRGVLACDTLVSASLSLFRTVWAASRAKQRLLYRENCHR